MKSFPAIKDIGKLTTLFPDKYKSFKIIDQSDNHILTEEIVSISGKEINQKVKHTLEPDRMLKSEVIEGDTKGTILIIELDPKSIEHRNKDRCRSQIWKNWSSSWHFCKTQDKTKSIILSIDSQKNSAK